MSRCKGSASAYALMVASLVAVGCGSDTSSISAGPAFPNFTGITQAEVSARTTVQESVAQATLTQGLGFMLAGAKFMAPFATGFRAFDPEIQVQLEGDYRLTRRPLADGNFRLDFFSPDGARLLGSAIASPARQITGGYEVTVTLGDARFRESAPQNVERREYPFFGLTGEAIMQFNNDGELLNVNLRNINQYGFEQTFGSVNGLLARNGDHLTGSLTYEGRGRLTVDALYNVSGGGFFGLGVASQLFAGGQGRAFLSSNFTSTGIFSPLDDPILSSPLVVTPIAPSFAAPNNNRYVSYTVVDGVFTVTTPPVPPATQPGVQSFDLLNAQPLNAPFPPIALPAGARLIVQAGPGGTVPVGTHVTVTVYAVNSVGKAVPFNTNGFQLASSNPQVASVGEGFQVLALAAGSTTLTLTDPSSGQSGTAQLTVQAAGATGTGFVYLSDSANQRIVRFRYNPASPALPTERTEIATGHAPQRILISADKSTLMAQNTDNTLQVFAINQSNGNLTERSAEVLSVTGLAQSQLDPGLFYGNSGSPNQIKEYRFNSANGTLAFQRNLRQGPSSQLTTGLIAGGQYVYGSFQNTIHSVDVATATSRDVTMGAGEFASNLAVTRLNSGSNVLLVLLRRSLGGGLFEGGLRLFPLNNDGTLNTPASQNIAVQSDAIGLVVNNDRAYMGAFANSFLMNGVQLTLTALTHLTGQPYGVVGTPNTLTTQGNLVFIGTNPEAKLETLIIGADGNLSTVGAVDIGGNATDIEAVVLP